MESTTSTVLITGASGGLGEGIARAWLNRGATVYTVSRREPKALLEAGGEQVRWASLDLMDAEAGPAAVTAFLKGVERLDAVVLNAGMLPPIADLKDTSIGSLRETMEVNVWANKWLLDTLFTVVPEVAQVVAISSGASVSGARGWNGYSISKAALNMLIRLYAQERPETHFSALAPGLVDTAMQDYLTGLPEDGRFPIVERLKGAKGTETMPDAETAGERCVAAFAALRELESGSYADIREMG